MSKLANGYYIWSKCIVGIILILLGFYLLSERSVKSNNKIFLLFSNSTFFFNIQYIKTSIGCETMECSIVKGVHRVEIVKKTESLLVKGGWIRLKTIWPGVNITPSKKGWSSVTFYAGKDIKTCSQFTSRWSNQKGDVLICLFKYPIDMRKGTGVLMVKYYSSEIVGGLKNKIDLLTQSPSLKNKGI